LAIERLPGWFGQGDAAFFGWQHHEPTAAPRGIAAVICAPIGHEYTRAHRTLRHLADRLAAAGVPAVRFDYHGVGDSPGTDLDPARLDRWLANIGEAIRSAKALGSCERVCLIGVRLGATLALMVSEANFVDRLVLWNPCIKGKRYLRELQAIAQTAARVAADGDGVLEAAGFVMSAETVAAIGEVDLLAVRPQVREKVLIVGRDDVSADAALSAHLSALGIATDSIAVPGWMGMMAEHQFTVVPDQALDAIVGWVAGDGAPVRAGAEPAAAEPSLQLEDGVAEEVCTFGDEGKLFGILSRKGRDAAMPVVLMFNAGSVHHVGTNRVYVTLARSLAAMGFACLRFDLEGIGDSVMRRPGRENHPYPAHAIADARAAIEYLKARGFTRFIALGLCSGAHTAFQAGLCEAGLEIEELVLINPLVYYYREGMSLEVIDNFSDAQAYKQSMRDPKRWLKLLRGDVNFRRLLQVAIAHPKTIARSYIDAAVETLMPSRAPRLSQDLRRLMAGDRRVTFLLSERDAAREILMTGAKRTVTRAVKAGKIRLEVIAGADHTFSQSRPRSEMIRRLSESLSR
jgi:alpha-beta hydrolase superfamily lysophospholipase